MPASPIMRILILGGTRFLGRYLVEQALGRGHSVTLFNRGRTHPELFPEAERLLGDRSGDLSALAGHRWDAAIDTSGYFERDVAASAELLRDAVERYLFVSTLNVYAGLEQADVREDAPLAEPEEGAALPPDDPAAYGLQKALCERALEAVFPGRTLVVRPGVLVGPHDLSERLAYWIERVAQGGEVLAPGRPDRRVQCLHAADLARWLVRAAEEGAAGAFNAAGPAVPLAMVELLAACRQATGSDARFTWVDEEFLLAEGVEPWSELPFWLPESLPGTLDISKALAAGLEPRPIGEVVADTWSWLAARRSAWPAGSQWSNGRTVEVGLGADREAALLGRWQASREPGAPDDLG
jgi:2'-hydroxyisoflavone reductase